MADINKLKTRARPKAPPLWKSDIRICVWCDEEFSPIRYRQKYCTPDCREKFWLSKRRWMPDPATVEMEVLQEFLSGYLRQCEFLPDHGEVTFKY